MFWKHKPKNDGRHGATPATFDADHLTQEHLGLLKAIGSPWCEIPRELADGPRTTSNVEAAYRRALRELTVAQFVEYAFVITRPAAESRVILIRSRAELTRAALAFVETQLPSQTLSQLVANGGALLIAGIKPGANSVGKT